VDWTVPGYGAIRHVQDPVIHTFTTAGTYLVTMQAANMWGFEHASMGVTVVGDVDGQLHCRQHHPQLGTTVHFTDSSTPAARLVWTFGRAGHGTGQTPEPRLQHRRHLHGLAHW
jgi:PKD repeat protein